MGGRSSQLRKFENHTILESEWNGSVLRAKPDTLNIVGTGADSALIELRTADGAPVIGAIITAVTRNAGVATAASPLTATDINGQTALVVDGVAAGVTAIDLGYPGDSQGAGKVTVIVT